MLHIRNKIKIAFVVWTLEGMAGSEHVVFDIVRKLDSKEYEISVVSLRDGPVRNLYEKLGVKVKVFEKEKQLDWRVIRAFRNYLIREHIDILNPHHLSPFYFSFLAARKTGVKILFTEHSVWQLEELGQARKVLNKIFFGKIDGLVAISEQIKRYYLDELKLPKDRVHLITNGIDLDRFKKVGADQKKLDLGLGLKDKIVGMVGNLRPEKNHRMLLSAFSKLAGETRDVHLLLVGLDCMDGEVQGISRKFAAADRIHFLGPREDIPEILNILDIFCLPSFHEGLPISLLEAMACEVPVVGSNVMGINEIIKDKENGFLFTIGDEEMLIKTMRSLLVDDELRRSIGQKGRRFVEENYSLEREIREYDALFDQLKYGRAQPS